MFTAFPTRTLGVEMDSLETIYLTDIGLDEGTLWCEDPFIGDELFNIEYKRRGAIYRDDVGDYIDHSTPVDPAALKVGELVFYIPGSVRYFPALVAAAPRELIPGVFVVTLSDLPPEYGEFVGLEGRTYVGAAALSNIRLCIEATA